LAPRSFTHVTRATCLLSLAEPASAVTAVDSVNVSADVGEVMLSEGGIRSRRASADSRTTAFGSTVSAPPHPPSAMQIAAIGVSRVLIARLFIIIEPSSETRVQR